MRRECPGHESAGGVIGGGVLKGDGAVSHRLSASAGINKKLGQVSAQPDVVGGGVHGTCQGINQKVGHPVSLEACSNASAVAILWCARLPRAPHHAWAH